jgi:hypothetical protein
MAADLLSGDGTLAQTSTLSRAHAAVVVDAQRVDLVDRISRVPVRPPRPLDDGVQIPAGWRRCGGAMPSASGWPRQHSSPA